MPTHNRLGLNNQSALIESIASWPKSSKGNRTIQVYPTEGTKKTFFSYNFTDPCSWYQQSVLVEDETLTDSGDHIIYEMSNTNIIDLQHGRLSDENNISNVSNYYVTVEVDSVEKTEDIDYTIDYESGEITFSSALSGTETVIATYHYENGSEFKIVPNFGKYIRIIASEAQFSKNVSITDTTLFQIYVDDQLYKSNAYKNAKDYINSANNGVGEIPAFGELIQPVLVFPWNYPASVDIKSSLSMDLRIKLENDEPFIGELATLALYCLIENE